MEELALNIASACFRVIALRWGIAGQSIHDFCRAETVTDGGYDACQGWARERALFHWQFGIAWQLRDTIRRLGWDEYRALDGSPLWDRIVVAGHSAGAGMAAYMVRQLGIRGAVFISGGGATATRSLRDGPPASWMEPPVPGSRRYVGMYHRDEGVPLSPSEFVWGRDQIPGWLDLDGVGPATADALARTRNYYETYGHADRLIARSTLDPWDAHLDTKGAQYKPAHMYLACRAAGRTIA